MAGGRRASRPSGRRPADRRKLDGHVRGLVPSGLSQAGGRSAHGRSAGRRARHGPRSRRRAPRRRPRADTVRAGHARVARRAGEEQLRRAGLVEEAERADPRPPGISRMRRGADPARSLVSATTIVAAPRQKGTQLQGQRLCRPPRRRPGRCTPPTAGRSGDRAEVGDRSSLTSVASSVCGPTTSQRPARPSPPPAA